MSSPAPVIRDRIKSLRRVKAKNLIPDKRNWRRHPPNQRKAVRKMLDRIGWIGAVIAREREDGKLVLVDGHLRANLDPEAKVPVLVLDLSEKEAGEGLATYDPLGAMATMDADAVSSLVSDLSAAMDPEEGDELRELMESMRLVIPDTQVEAEWEGMPEFSQQEEAPHRNITVHFRTQEDVEEFGRRLDVELPKKMRSMFFPPTEEDLVRSAHVRYKSAPGEASDPPAAEDGGTETTSYDYEKVGGGPAVFTVRKAIANDLHVIREVACYSVMDVRGREVLDVGAHIGGFSTLAGQLGAAFVTAVEPDPRNVEVLRPNLARNLPDRSELIHAAAVSGAEERVTLYTKPTPSMNSSHVRGGTPIEVPAIRWADLLSRRDYEAIKLDCEGAEYDLLLDGGTLPDSVRAVVMELHLGRKAWRNEKAPEVLALFEDWECVREPEVREVNWVTWGAWRR